MRILTRIVLTDAVLSTAAGYLATKVMEPVSMKLYDLEPARCGPARTQPGPGMPARVAAQKLTQRVGLHLSDARLDRLSLVLHYGLAIQWAPRYALLRRRRNLNPITAGLATGAAMSIIADELITPAFGFSAPNLDYPLLTHLRGFIAHLVFGPVGSHRHRNRLGPAPRDTPAATLTVRKRKNWARHQPSNQHRFRQREPDQPHQQEPPFWAAAAS